MINYNVDTDGIATVTWDMPNRTMNVLNEQSITAYADALQKALKDEKVKGIIVTSGKADFIAGADLEMLLAADTSDATALTEQFSQLQKLFRQLENVARRRHFVGVLPAGDEDGRLQRRQLAERHLFARHRQRHLDHRDVASAIGPPGLVRRHLRKRRQTADDLFRFLGADHVIPLHQRQRRTAGRGAHVRRRGRTR